MSVRLKKLRHRHPQGCGTQVGSFENPVNVHERGGNGPDAIASGLKAVETLSSGVSRANCCLPNYERRLLKGALSERPGKDARP